MRTYYKYIILLCPLVLLTLGSCTENPFYNAPKIGAAQISGQIVLSNEVDNGGVYVWLEKIGASTYTNSDGDFLIAVPPPESQGGGGGIDGDLFIYFYLANYRLDSAKVSFLRGVPLLSKADLNEEGSVARIIELSKLLNVKISFLKKSISMSSPESLRVKITLTSPEVEPVATVMAKANSREYAPPSPAFFIKKVDSEDSIFKMIDIGYHVELVNFISKSVTVIYEMNIGFSDGELPTGTYEVIPYVIVRDVNPPVELLNGLGEHPLEYHPDYLKLPFKLLTESIILRE